MIPAAKHRCAETQRNRNVAVVQFAIDILLGGRRLSP
jgi:hypothetical protein